MLDHCFRPHIVAVALVPTIRDAEVMEHGRGFGRGRVSTSANAMAAREPAHEFPLSRWRGRVTGLAVCRRHPITLAQPRDLRLGTGAHSGFA
jgi:hypothetical protein